jgi:hypothetical protein
MAKLTIKTADDCKWDILSLGEVMLRLDPGDTRVARTRQFQVWEKAAANTMLPGVCGVALECGQHW